MAELSATDPAPRPLGRRLLRWIGFSVAGVAALILMALIALQTPPARRFVERKVTEFLARQDITFASEGFRYNVFGLGADLRNVRVFSPRLPDAPPFLELDRRAFRSELVAIDSRPLRPGSGTVEGVAHSLLRQRARRQQPAAPARRSRQPRPADRLPDRGSQVPNAGLRYENRQRTSTLRCRAPH